ncbi:MAG: SUF system NifU family Fe-S cluster assembly protein [archaeon]|nr:SUF system NifU family Fe-S cluster assembly protein [archaeon]
MSEVKQNVSINKEISKTTETTETIDQELYQENILDHYKNPHNKLEMIDCTVKHPELNPLCGDKIVLYLKIVDGIITDVSFQGDGCAISQASISMLTDLIKGKTLNVVKTYTEKDVYDLLGIPISHTRQKCALLSLKALRNGLTSLEEENA